MKYKRRGFLKVSGLLLGSLFFPACGREENEFEKILPPADLGLVGNESDSEKVESQWEKMQKVAKGEENLKVGFPDESGKRQILDVGIENHRLVLTNFRTGQKAYVDLDTINLAPGQKDNLDLWPQLKFTDAAGDVLRDTNGGLLQFSFSDFIEEDMTAAGWLLLGVKVFAAGLAVWLGFKIAGAIIAAIAWLGFNLLVLGILIGAISVFSWLINLTGWNWGEVKNFFYSFSAKIGEVF